jgi:DNA-binding transcriptional MerR regulator
MRPVLLLACVLAPFGFAAEGETPVRPVGAPPRGGEALPSLEEVQTIRRILELPPERLSRIRMAIERLERMSPEARADYATRLARYEQASPEDRLKIMKEMRERGFSSRLLEHHLKTLAPDKANEERARYLALSPEERQDYIHKLAEKYAGEFGKGKAGDKKEDGKRRKDEPAPAAPDAGK